MRRITRRDALKGMAVAGLSAPSIMNVLGHTAPAFAIDDDTPPGSSWTPILANPVIQTTGSGSDNLRMHPALLPVGWMLPNPLDAWYLWTSTHDGATKWQLYTAPKPEGPYKFRQLLWPPSPSPPTHNTAHWSAIDVAWDPIGQRLVATPHTHRTEGIGQDSFLIQSTDGINWSWVGPATPKLVCGDTPGVPDLHHSGYGRLLRDLDGHLSMVGGKYWWIYRATQPEGPAFRYRPWLASAPTLETEPWVKEPTVAFVNSPDHTVNFVVGSFLRAANKHWVYIRGQRRASSGLNFAFGEPQGVSIVGPPHLPSYRSPNIIRHPETGEQWLVQCNAAAPPNNQTQVWIHREAL